MTYAEKLKDPRWQRKRLEIMERDNFKCRNCESGEKTLHVHHIRYIRGRSPWEYKDFYLVTLCEDCHEAEELELKEASKPKPKEDAPHPSLPIQSTKNEWGDQQSTPEDLDKFFSNLKAMLGELAECNPSSKPQ